VLDALIGAARAAGVVLRHPFRVTAVAREGEAFALTASDGKTMRARASFLATGGRSLPKTGPTAAATRSRSRSATP
jgi:predicted flavoprotein YhiN